MRRVVERCQDLLRGITLTQEEADTLVRYVRSRVLHVTSPLVPTCECGEALPSPTAKCCVACYIAAEGNP